MKHQVALDMEKDEKEDFSIAQLEQLDQVLSETIEALDASHQKALKQEKRMNMIRIKKFSQIDNV